MIIMIDGNYLANRAFYSVGHLTHADIPTGVPFGMLSEAGWLVERFQCDNLVWCFDKGRSIRTTILPGYKSSRQADPEVDPEKAEQRMAIRGAVVAMVADFLPSMGYSNIWWKESYEADDIMAQYAMHHSKEEIVIVSSDSDLYQLLIYPWVTIWNPQTKIRWDADTFYEKKGVDAGEWATVKAIAGCTTDDIPGIRGVGEKTAIQWLHGELKESSKKYRDIQSSMGFIDFNRKLVQLPFPGTPEFEVKPNTMTVPKWEALCHRLGFNDATMTMPKLFEGIPDVIERPKS